MMKEEIDTIYQAMNKIMMELMDKIIKAVKSNYYLHNPEIDPDANLEHQTIEWHTRRMNRLGYNDAEKVEYIQALMDIAIEKQNRTLSTICTDLAHYLIFGTRDGSHPDTYAFFRKMIEIDRTVGRRD